MKPCPWSCQASLPSLLRRTQSPPAMPLPLLCPLLVSLLLCCMAHPSGMARPAEPAALHLQHLATNSAHSLQQPATATRTVLGSKPSDGGLVPLAGVVGDHSNARLDAAGSRKALGLAPGDVTVVNDIASHFEVLAGVVQVLRQLGVPPRVLFAGNVDSPKTLGLINWLDQGLGAATAGPTIDWVPIRTLSSGTAMRAKLVICISAEMAPQVCQEFVDRLQPVQLLIWVHRADTATPTAKILRMHSSYKLLALAPHVATLAQTRLRQPVDWATPLAIYRPQQPCTALSCLSGFVVQGALRKYRSKAAAGFTRNYTALWERMVQLKRHSGAAAAGAAGRVRVYVLGKGGFRSHLGIPAEVDGDVEYLERLPYPEFWGRIYTSFALIPAFGMPVYYESRISSTILASLVTGTPLVAEQKLLDTYTFLGPEHVFLRSPEEDEVQAMYRIVAMSEEEVMKKRRALVDLAGRLNLQAGETFKGLLKAAGVTLQ